MDTLAFPIKTGWFCACSKPSDSQPETSPALNDFYTSSPLPFMWKDLSKSFKIASALRITDKDFSPPNGMVVRAWACVWGDCGVLWITENRSQEQGGRLSADRTAACFLADRDEILCGCVHTHILYMNGYRISIFLVSILLCSSFSSQEFLPLAGWPYRSSGLKTINYPKQGSWHPLYSCTQGWPQPLAFHLYS